MAPKTSAAPALQVAAVPAAVPAPIFGRAAIAILGSMLFLIVALTVVLVRTTWAASNGTQVEAPAGGESLDADLAHR